MAESNSAWIIDDDRADRKIISRFLRRSGFPWQVTEFALVKDALAISPDSGPEIAFVDYYMPEMDGVTAVSKLLEIWPDLAIVVVTGAGDEKIAAGAIGGGATDYIPKRDMTESAIRRSADTALKLARLRSRVSAQRRDLEAFVQVLVHDLAAPIRGVDMLSDIVMEHAAARDFEAIPELAQKMQNQVRRMSALLKSLRSYAFMDRPPSFERVNAADIVADATDNLSMEIHDAAAKIEIGALPSLYGDRAQLTQLFQNIIANGVKFCRNRHPVVRILDGGGCNGVSRIVFADNGIGIAAQDLPKVFEPFKRLNHQSDFLGTGLGLATCARIVGRHHGRIRVQSTLDVGTEIHLELPSHAAPEVLP